MMILGLGIDIIYEDRVEKIYNNFGYRFVKKVLSQKEIEIYNTIIDKNKKINFLTKRFSSKESFLKALGIGLGNSIKMSDISVLNNLKGKPEIILEDGTLKYINKLYNIENIHFNISITDEKNLINTIVIISND